MRRATILSRAAVGEPGNAAARFGAVRRMLVMSSLSSSALAVMAPNAAACALGFGLVSRLLKAVKRWLRRLLEPAAEEHAAGAVGIDGELADILAAQERVVPVQRDRHRDLIVRVEGIEQVGEAAAPAGVERLVGDAALPLHTGRSARRAGAACFGRPGSRRAWWGAGGCRRWRARRVCRH